MNREEFEILKDMTKQPVVDPCIKCGNPSDRSIHGIKGGKSYTRYYCNEHYIKEVRNVRRKEEKRNRNN